MHTKFYSENLKARDLLGRQRIGLRTLKNNSTTELKEKLREDVNWIQVALDMVQWRDSLKMVMILRVPLQVGNLSTWRTIHNARRTLLYGNSYLDNKGMIKSGNAYNRRVPKLSSFWLLYKNLKIKTHTRLQPYPVCLCRPESCSLALGKNILSVLKVLSTSHVVIIYYCSADWECLRKTSGPNTMTVTGGQGILQYEALHNVYTSSVGVRTTKEGDIPRDT